jgi:hypothetical protein
MGVDESFCYKKPKMEVSNADEREAGRLVQCLEVRARLREVVEGSWEDELDPLCVFWALSYHAPLFPTTQAKTFSHALFALLGGEFLNGDGGAEFHGN